MSFSKMTLAILVLSALTACGSGGSSGNNTQTTSANENISIPNDQGLNTSSPISNNSSTITEPTTKVDLGNLRGSAIYSGVFSYDDSGIFSRAINGYFPRSGVFTLNADFDKKIVFGNAKLDTKQARYKSYRQIRNGARIVFEETKLYRDKDGDIAFNGTANGVVNDVLDATYNGASAPYDVKGKYEGYFHGNNASDVELRFDVKSPNDSRVGAFGLGSGAKQQ